jgi:hypothetical protein
MSTTDQQTGPEPVTSHRNATIPIYPKPKLNSLLDHPLGTTLALGPFRSICMCRFPPRSLWRDWTSCGRAAEGEV